MNKKIIRFAVIGLGDISQEAVLPSFEHSENAQLAMLVSNDPEKLKKLGKMYSVTNLLSYDEYKKELANGTLAQIIDAVYIALPNHLHKDYTVGAAKAGLHVLCEKPLAVTSNDCKEMIRACMENQVKLMTAYRLHFEEGNLTAIDIGNEKRKLGELRMFQSIHSQAQRVENIRTLPISKGGGPTYDMGIYDINAARYLFQAEPISVCAQASHISKRGFENVEESMSVTLKFPGERLASILISFGTIDNDRFTLVGTQGKLSLEPAYGYVGEKTLKLEIEEKTHEQTIPAHDQFASEIDYFSRCILNDEEIEPSGEEGLADVRIIEAIHEAARTGKTIELEPFQKNRRPNLEQMISYPAVQKVKLIHAESPSKDDAA